MVSVRRDRSDETRVALMSAAERLFAERGLDAVSNRQISEAAGQANNYAVGYHFGSRADLLTALLESHQEPLDVIRARTVEDLGDEPGLRDWLRCLVQPQLEYIDTRPGPCYFGQFWLAMATTPSTAELLYREAAKSRPLSTTLNGMYGSLPALPEEAIRVRNLMSQNSLIATYADFERRRNELGASDSSSWQGFSDSMVDGLLGLWSAPASSQ